MALVNFFKRASVLLAFALTACGPSEQEARDAVEAFGLENVTLFAPAAGGIWAGCGQSDYWAWRFQATNVRGRRVAGVVCVGAFKAATVRIGK